MEKINFYRSYEFFRNLSAKLMFSVSAEFKEIKTNNPLTIYETDEKVDHIYLVKQGKIQIFLEVQVQAEDENEMLQVKSENGEKIVFIQDKLA